jgi:hypothetical protein
MGGGPTCAWAIFAVGLLTSCTYWEPYPRPTPGASPVRLPGSLRATTATVPAIMLTAPFVRADTLFGRRAGDTVGIALQELRGLERPRVHAARTVGLLLGATAGWVTLGLLTGGLE